MEHILVVEDDPAIRDVLRRGFTHDGYKVTVASEAMSGLEYANELSPDLVILDWMMPGEIDGLEACKRLRAASDVLIILLTAKDSIQDRVLGLDSGADDYLVKPFAFPELLARVNALFRRAGPTPKPEILRYADLTLDTGTRIATRGEEPFELTAREYDLLEYLMRNPRQVLTREQILERVWGYNFGGESNVLEVYVRYLRQKTETNRRSRLIHTVRSVGYVLREE